jgi:hypothetical protein
MELLLKMTVQFSEKFALAVAAIALMHPPWEITEFAMLPILFIGKSHRVITHPEMNPKRNP